MKTIDGEAEVDERYFGRHRKGNRGRKSTGFHYPECSGRVYAKAIPAARDDALILTAGREVLPDSIGYFDNGTA